MSKCGKSVYLLTFQVLSPRLTHQMMTSVQISVDEIVTTCDSAGALLYALIHLPRKVTEQDMDKAIKTLAATYGVKGSNIFGYDTIASSSINSAELIEDHPGFRVLVHHETTKNEDFHRWTSPEFSSVNCGYNLLKARLLAKRIPVSGESSTAAGGGMPNFEGSSAREQRFPDDSGGVLLNSCILISVQL
jgi:hypothetical protein